MLTIIYIITTIIEKGEIDSHHLTAFLIIESVGMIYAALTTWKHTLSDVENWHTYHRIIQKKGAKEWSKIPKSMMSPLTQRQVIIVLAILWPIVALIDIVRKAISVVEDL